MRNRWLRRLGGVLLALAGILAVQPSSLWGADLKPATVKAFQVYVKAAEARMAREGRQRGDFLYIDQLPKAQYGQVMTMLRQGQVYVARIQTLDDAGKQINVPGGMVHHWVGDAFVPGTSIASAFEALRNYNNYKEIYKPQIIRSRLISHHGNNYKIYLRMQKSSIVSVTLDTWYSIHISEIDSARGLTRSYSTRIQQVEDAGTPQEHLDPVGHDSGYLWRIDSYWRYEQVKGGMIVEWESIALSRPIPFLLAWFVKPLVRSIARDTVTDMLKATRKAVLAEKAKQAPVRESRQGAKSGTSNKSKRDKLAGISSRSEFYPLFLRTQ